MGTHPIFESDFDCLTEFEWWVGERHGSLIRPLFQQIIAEQVEIIVS